MALRRHVAASAAAAATTATLLLPLLLLAPAGAAAGATPIHKHMSPAELRHVFQVDSHDLVPQYEVVRLRSSPGVGGAEGAAAAGAGADGAGAGARTVRLSAFGRPLRLRLQAAEGLVRGGRLRAWAASPNASAPHRLSYDELPHHEEEEIGQAFQDERTLAALLLRKDARDGKLLMEGTIGHDLVLKPVPARVRQHLDDAAEDADADAEAEESVEDDEAWLDEAGEDPRDDVAVGGGFPLGRARRAAPEPTHPHIVFRRSASAAGPPSDYAFMEPDLLLKRVRRARRGARTSREAPYVIYPEILVIVDYDGYRLHGGDNVQIKRYFVSFWNGVDLRYKLLKGPKIRISIAGIIISRGRDATPYLERNRVGRDAIDSAAALTDMGKYLFRERRLPVYDIAVAITKYDMCRRRKGGRCTKGTAVSTNITVIPSSAIGEKLLDMCRRQFANDVCNRGTAGFAYVGGACVVNKRLEKVNSVAIIEDTGGFSGIIVGAHEVGHLLGAVHDGSPPPSYLGGPGAEKCRWEDGFIMSDLRHTEKGFRWSPCSVASFHHFLNGDTATCLYNSPHEDESLPRVLPGKLLTLDAQCRKDRGTSACFKDDRVCAQLFCFDAGSGYCVAYRPAAEGSPCGDGQYCLNGRCVAEHENIIPDYSQNTPTYIRRSDAASAATQSRPVYASPNNITRSPWDGRGWGSSSTYAPDVSRSTTPNTQRPTNYYNTFSTSTENPYYQFNRPTQNPNAPNQSPGNIFDNQGRPRTSVTTIKNPYSVDISPLRPSTTKNPYDFSNLHQFRKQSSNRNPTSQNPYQQQSVNTHRPNPYQPYNAYHGTTKQYQSAYYQSASNNEPISIYGNASNVTTNSNVASNTTIVTESVAGTECEDKVTDIAGSMTCREFLSHYGFQYCSYRYMQQNCCKSQKEVCEGRNWRKRK